MLRFAFLVALATAIAIGGGGASVWWALDRAEGFGAMTIDGWVAWPEAGTANVDPYSRARNARSARLPLGPGEGLSFSTDRDSTGQQLRRDCSYRLNGAVPVSRFWTLSVQGGSEAARDRPLHSTALLRFGTDDAEIRIGRTPEPGNWLPVSGDGPMSVVLTLYDTPIGRTTGVGEVRMPAILRERCDG